MYELTMPRNLKLSIQIAIRCFVPICKYTVPNYDLTNLFDFKVAISVAG